MVLRTIFTTLYRMVYPFLGAFSRGMGVDIATLSFVLIGRSLVAAFIPFVASISDQRGRRFGMLTGIALFTFGVSLVVISPSIWTFSAAIILGLFGKYLYDPATQAYLGDQVPYERRGLAIAITEVGWSLSLIIGVPVIGYLIANFGWSAPFPVFTILGLVMFAVVWRNAPREDPNPTLVRKPWLNFGIVLRNPVAMAGISIAFWASASNELVNLIFGVWLEDSFGLQIAALAGASAVIGFAELSGEGLVAFLTDRIGKPRALKLGISASAITALMLPFIGRTEVGALIGLFLFYISFEYVMVSHLPLMTELVPSARATIMSFNLTGISLGRVIGASLATFIYSQFGFLYVALLAVIFNFFGLRALSRLQKYGGTP